MTQTVNFLDIIEENGKFVVTKNGQPIKFPKTNGSHVVTEFDTRNDAERYLNILKTFLKR